MRIIRKPELARMLGCSIQTIWRMEKRGELPKRIQISRNIVGWRESEIKEFIESRPTADSPSVE